MKPAIPVNHRLAAGYFPTVKLINVVGGACPQQGTEESYLLVRRFLFGLTAHST